MAYDKAHGKGLTKHVRRVLNNAAKAGSTTPAALLETDRGVRHARRRALSQTVRVRT